MNFDVELMKEEQLSRDIDELLDKYGIEYAHRIKTMLNVKIERRKEALKMQKEYLKRQVRSSYERDWTDTFSSNNTLKR